MKFFLNLPSPMPHNFSATVAPSLHPDREEDGRQQRVHVAGPQELLCRFGEAAAVPSKELKRRRGAG
jgi:hypothetical protein